MKKSFVSLLLSAIAGVAVGLTITLRLWGPEWYKVIVAVLVGVVGGLFINSPKDFRQTIKLAFNQSLDAISQLPYFGNKIATFCAEKIPGIKMVLIRMSFRLGLALAIFIFYAAVLSVIVYIAMRLGFFYTLFASVKSGTFDLFLATAICAVGVGAVLLSGMVISSQMSFWRTALTDKETKRIWKGKWGGHSIDDMRENLVPDYFWQAIYSKCSYAEIFNSVMLTVMLIYCRSLWHFVKNIFGLVIFLPVWGVIVVLDLMLLLLMLLHIAAADKSRLVMIISIALGIVLGTVFSSFFLGFAIGGGSVIIGYLTGKYFPDELENTLLSSFNGARVVAVTRESLFKPLFRA